MHFGLSEEQDMIVNTVRAFVENEIYPHEAMVERTGQVPLELGLEIKQKVIDLCRKRSANGLRGLRVMFKAMDRNRNGTLSPVEFKYAMRDYGLNISEIEVTQIVKHFDTNKDGMLSFDEFLRAIRGSLNERRRDLVHQAYKVLDKDGSG